MQIVMRFMRKKINTSVPLNLLNESGKTSMQGYLGIVFIDIGPDFLKAKMPVNRGTKQPLGLLHGGASVVLAETLGSVASGLCLDLSKQYPVGLEVNANHLKSVSDGFVYGTAKAVRIGRRTHVWQIEIVNEANELICISRLTVMIVNKEENS